MKYIAALQTLVALATLLIIAFVAWRFSSWWKSKAEDPGGAIGAAGSFLKDETLFGAPARGIDNVISDVTGRTETLGGWLAEMLDANTRKVNNELSGAADLETGDEPARDFQF
jgi:hypothetical protein